jgi:hypothetical protein
MDVTAQSNWRCSTIRLTSNRLPMLHDFDEQNAVEQREVRLFQWLFSGQPSAPAGIMSASSARAVAGLMSQLKSADRAEPASRFTPFGRLAPERDHRGGEGSGIGMVEVDGSVAPDRNGCR